MITANEALSKTTYNWELSILEDEDAYPNRIFRADKFANTLWPKTKEDLENRINNYLKTGTKSTVIFSTEIKHKKLADDILARIDNKIRDFLYPLGYSVYSFSLKRKNWFWFFYNKTILKIKISWEK